MRISAFVSIAVAAGLTAACQSSSLKEPTAYGGGVVNYSLTPTEFTLAVGAQRALTISRMDTIIAVSAAQWTTSDTSIATVSQSGVVLARQVGTATIVATSRVNPTLASAARLTVE
jgi:uncharacterized protein YjdB